MLVEGDAEEILIPVMIKQVLGVSLDELGISLINIRSTGFKNVALLFNEDRIRKKCGIITDLDATILDTSPDPTDSRELKELKRKCQASQDAGESRRGILTSFEANNNWVKAFYADHTFEVDFIKCGNVDQVVATINDVYTLPSKIAEAKEEIESGDVRRFGSRVLKMVAQEGKGWFAILLSKQIHTKTVIPDYILDAIFFTNPNFSTEVWANIFKYRLKYIKNDDSNSEIIELTKKIEAFQLKELTFEAIRNEISKTLKTDIINKILGKF